MSLASAATGRVNRHAASQDNGQAVALTTGCGEGDRRLPWAAAIAPSAEIQAALRGIFGGVYLEPDRLSRSGLAMRRLAGFTAIPGVHLSGLGGSRDGKSPTAWTLQAEL
jgi:hypothetical protein